MFEPFQGDVSLSELLPLIDEEEQQMLAYSECVQTQVHLLRQNDKHNHSLSLTLTMQTMHFLKVRAQRKRRSRYLVQLQFLSTDAHTHMYQTALGTCCSLSSSPFPPELAVWIKVAEVRCIRVCV